MSAARRAPGDVERGIAFTYYGPRRGILRRRGIAAGVVVGVDLAIGIVHVRTMRTRGDAVTTDIGHVPILASAFARSLHALGGKAPQVADDASGDVSRWRLAFLCDNEWDLVFHTSAAERALAVVEALERDLASVTLIPEVEPDAEWSYYRYRLAAPGVETPSPTKTR